MSERLLLRRFTPDDGPALHAYLSQPQTVRFEPYGVQSPASCARWAAARATDEAFWAVCLRPPNGADAVLIGNLWLSPTGPAQWLTWELGYVFNAEHTGHGYATESARRLLDHCFGTLGADRVVAQCDVLNDSSWRLLERLGMRREAHRLANASFNQGADGEPEWVDSYQYAVLDREWAQGTRPAEALPGKLVRDGIPALLDRDQVPGIVMQVTGERLDGYLHAKLEEEVAEFLADDDPMELADILEVCFALAGRHGVSEPDLLALRDQKRRKRGGFDDAQVWIR